MEFGVFDHLDATAAAARLLRGPPADRRSLRPRRLLRLSRRRAPCDAARHGALAQRFLSASRSAPETALRPAGLYAAALSPAAADRGNLHARPDEPRAPRVGVGRGSPIEIEYFGVDPDEAQAIYPKLQLVLKGLTRRCSTQGKHTSFKDVPMEIEPLQKPHPPIWYGVHSRTAPSARRAAGSTWWASIRCGNAALDRRLPRSLARRRIARRLRSEARARPFRLVSPRPTPRRWRSPVAPTGLARELHPPVPPARPAAIASAARDLRPGDGAGQGIAGSPRTVTGLLCAQLARTGGNYAVGQFAFGDMTLAESLRSIGLFAAR